MKTMVRRAANDFEAMQTSDAMLRAGADVFSVTYNGMHQPHGAMEPSARFLVWAKVVDDAHIGRVDAEIEIELS